MEEYAPIFRAVGIAAQAAYIYLAILAIVVIALSIGIVRYITKKKNAPENGEDENQKPKKFVPARVGIVVGCILLLLLVSPLIYLAIKG